MATERQIAANRLNALRSTGPKSPEGKARASLNALTHGFTAQQLVLSIEDQAAFEQLRQALFDEHQPATPTEVLLVERIVAAAWRLSRIRSAATAALDRAIRSRSESYPKEDSLTLLSRALCGDIDWHDRLARYEARLDRTLSKALAELRDLRARRPPAPPSTPSSQKPSPQIGFVFSETQESPSAPPSASPVPANPPSRNPHDPCAAIPVRYSGDARVKCGWSS